jgi:hypothetical protein
MGLPLGPPLRHQGGVVAVAFSPDGRTLLTASPDDPARLSEVPAAVRGDLEQVVLWVQLLTGLELDPDDIERVLPGPVWRDRHRRSEQLAHAPAP